MPKLACWSCGRQITSVAPLNSLFSEERRCPRCGVSLNEERRAESRRSDTSAATTHPTIPGHPRKGSAGSARSSLPP